MSKRAGRREGRGRKSLPKTVPAGVPAPVTDGAGGIADRLSRLLDGPRVTDLAPRLAPEILHLLIQHRGLDACGALIAAATPKQLASVLDIDLWHAPAPGRDDRLDERRFGLWLETLIDEGEAIAARVVAAMDRKLAIAGLSRYVRVFDPGVLPSASRDDGPGDLDRSPLGSLECDVGGYVVRARTAEAWDSIVALLVALAAEHAECFHSLMQGCRRLSNSTPEADGFYTLLQEPEQLLHDVAADRQRRRSQQGYLAAADARAFLQMARLPETSRPMGVLSLNAIALAYFRALDDVEGATGQGSPEEEPAPASTDAAVSESIEAIGDLLAEAGIASLRPRALLAQSDVTHLTPIESLMAHIHDMNPAAYFVRNRELAFLANVVQVGCSVHSRSFSPQEAWNVAVGVCNLGLDVWPARWPQTVVESAGPADRALRVADSFLADHDLVAAFEVGWRLLYDDVSLFVTEQVIATLAELRSIDSTTQRELYQARRSLMHHRDAGAPWRARDALDVIATLDMPSWACLQGLLSECPVFPAVLMAILEGRTAPVSATAFECFATNAQLGKVREFLQRLANALRR